mmetsp:Transcript_3638/g.7593  ORF Transcript_3638/g.7593 Transcript_3638/m.7593 type:complete len:205 (-) Transcript_3638:964-1578(-)
MTGASAFEKFDPATARPMIRKTNSTAATARPADSLWLLLFLAAPRSRVDDDGDPPSSEESEEDASVSSAAPPRISSSTTSFLSCRFSRRCSCSSFSSRSCSSTSTSSLFLDILESTAAAIVDTPIEEAPLDDAADASSSSHPMSGNLSESRFAEDREDRPDGTVSGMSLLSTSRSNSSPLRRAGGNCGVEGREEEEDRAPMVTA